MRAQRAYSKTEQDVSPGEKPGRRGRPAGCRSPEKCPARLEQSQEALRVIAQRSITGPPSPVNRHPLAMNQIDGVARTNRLIAEQTELPGARWNGFTYSPVIHSQGLATVGRLILFSDRGRP